MTHTRVISGDRVGKQGKLRLGCSATLFDPTRQRVLLTRRTDNGLWCLPGGGMKPGESVEETCIREMQEETGLVVRVKRLIGVYSTPHILVIYPDGNQAQIVAINFEVELVSGECQPTSEACEFGFFSLQEAETLELMIHHRERIRDVFAEPNGAFYR